MTTEALYYQTKLQANRLGIGVGVNLEPAIWVSLYNAAQSIWFDQALQTKSSSVLRDQLNTLLVQDKEIKPVQIDERVYRFNLASNLYQLTDVLVNASKKDCKRSFPAEPVSPQWVNTNWTNPLAQPSFDWEETGYLQSKDQLLVYYTDFKVNSVLLSYYESPVNVDLPGYEHLDGHLSKTINSSLPDKLQQEILSILLPMLK